MIFDILLLAIILAIILLGILYLSRSNRTYCNTCKKNTNHHSTSLYDEYRFGGGMNRIYCNQCGNEKE